MVFQIMLYHPFKFGKFKKYNNIIGLTELILFFYNLSITIDMARNGPLDMDRLVKPNWIKPGT